MILEVGLIVVSIPIGYALRKSSLIVNNTGHALTGIIYAMLFFIGLNLGSNEELLLRLADLGVQGVVVGLCSAFGSIFVLCFLFRSFFPDLPPPKLLDKGHDQTSEQKHEQASGEVK